MLISSVNVQCAPAICPARCKYWGKGGQAPDPEDPNLNEHRARQGEEHRKKY